MSVDSFAKLICPNGHEVAIYEVRTLEKGIGQPDLGKIECPQCRKAWCACATHGGYECPPPCPSCARSVPRT
jgi:hypothetical protein